MAGMKTDLHEGIGHLLDGPKPPVIDLIDPDDFEAGDGVRVAITTDALHIMVRRYEREGGCIIPLEAILDAIATLAQKTGS